MYCPFAPLCLFSFFFPRPLSLAYLMSWVPSCDSTTRNSMSWRTTTLTRDSRGTSNSKRDKNDHSLCSMFTNRCCFSSPATCIKMSRTNFFFFFFFEGLRKGNYIRITYLICNPIGKRYLEELSFFFFSHPSLFFFFFGPGCTPAPSRTQVDTMYVTPSPRCLESLSFWLFRLFLFGKKADN